MRFARHMALFPLGKQPGMEQEDFGVLQMNLSAGPSKTVGVSCLIYGNYTVQTVLPEKAVYLISYADGVTRSVDVKLNNSPI
jgi:hypothetical protein